MFLALPEKWADAADAFKHWSAQWQEQGEFWSFAELEKTCQSPSACFLHEKGCLILLGAAQDFELLFLWVDPTQRRQGIAEEMLRATIKECASRRIFLEVGRRNEAALKLYQKCGFKLVRMREKYYKNGDDALIMEIQC